MATESITPYLPVQQPLSRILSLTSSRIAIIMAEDQVLYAFVLTRCEPDCTDCSCGMEVNPVWRGLQQGQQFHIHACLRHNLLGMTSGLTVGAYEIMIWPSIRSLVAVAKIRDPPPWSWRPETRGLLDRIEACGELRWLHRSERVRTI